MSDTPIRDALTKPIEIPDLPDNEIVLAGQVTKDDAGVTLQAETDPGKPGGFFAGAYVQWWKSQGYKAMAWVGWKK